MTIKPIIFDEILFGNLAPWRTDIFDESNFRNILNQDIRSNSDKPQLFFHALTKVLRNYNIHLNIEPIPDFANLANFANLAELQNDFSILSIPPFFNKASEFYNYLIHNENIRIRAAVATNLKKSKTAIDSEYQISSLLKNLDYTIEQVAHKKYIDKLSTYVLNAVKISIFRLYEEIKAVYPLFIGSEALSEFEIIDFIAPEFETEKTAQNSISFQINQFLNAKQPTSVIEKNKASRKLQPLEIAYCSFTYKHLSTQSEYIKDLFDSLKSNNFIEKATIYTDFKKAFTGEQVVKPVIWTGNISELHYFIKLIHNINKSVVDLKQHQWEVACKCFIKPDGSAFERVQLKEQKKPKTSASLIEKVAKQLL